MKYILEWENAFIYNRTLAPPNLYKMINYYCRAAAIYVRYSARATSFRF